MSLYFSFAVFVVRLIHYVFRYFPMFSLYFSRVLMFFGIFHCFPYISHEILMFFVFLKPVFIFGIFTIQIHIPWLYTTPTAGIELGTSLTRGWSANQLTYRNINIYTCNALAFLVLHCSCKNSVAKNIRKTKRNHSKNISKI